MLRRSMRQMLTALSTPNFFKQPRRNDVIGYRELYARHIGTGPDYTQLPHELRNPNKNASAATNRIVDEVAGVPSKRSGR